METRSPDLAGGNRTFRLRPLTVRTSPRISLFFLAEFLQFIAVTTSGFGLILNNHVLLLLGTPIWLAWMGLVFMVARPGTDRVLKGHQAGLARGAVMIVAFLLIVGLLEFLMIADVPGWLNMAQGPGTVLGKMVGAFAKVSRYNDGSSLAHQAVQNVIAGKNPYRYSNTVTALIASGGTLERATPLRVGRLAGQTVRPDNTVWREICRQALIDIEDPPPEMESKYPYPAGSFLLPAPFFLVGIKDIRIVYAIFAVLAFLYAVRLTPRGQRLVLVGAGLISLEIWNSIAAGETSVLAFAFILLGWALIRKHPVQSAVFMGLAVAIKQTAWFLLPFYLICFFRSHDRERHLQAVAIVAGIFLALNGPFLASDPRLWFSSVMGPLLDKVFPLGVGSITLLTNGVIKGAPPVLFAVAELAVYGLAIAWYVRHGRENPSTGLVLGVLPLFFAWRSLWTYFFYTGLMTLAAVMIGESGPVEGAPAA